MKRSRVHSQGEAPERVFRWVQVLLVAAGCAAALWISAVAAEGDPAPGVGSGLARHAGETIRADAPGSRGVAPVDATPPAPSPVRSGGELRACGGSIDGLMGRADEGGDPR